MARPPPRPGRRPGRRSGGGRPRSGPAVDPVGTALRNACPRCGEGRLYRGAFSLSFRDRCAACGLDYTAADVGDGAVVPVMMVANFLVLGLALWLHFSLAVPVWLNALVTIALALAVVGWLSRAVKAWLFAQQLRHDAAPGRLDR